MKAIAASRADSRLRSVGRGAIDGRRGPSSSRRTAAGWPPSSAEHRGDRHVLDQTRQADRAALPRAGAPVRAGLHRLPAHPDGLDVVPQLVDDRAASDGSASDNFVRACERQAVLDLARLHPQIHALHHADPDDRRLPDRAARRARTRRSRRFTRGDRLRAGRHRARRLEPALVLAVQLPTSASSTGCCSTSALIDKPIVWFGEDADRVALGGDRLDRLEGDRLRHAAVRRRDPGHPARDQRGGRWSTARATGSASGGSPCR